MDRFLRIVGVVSIFLALAVIWDLAQAADCIDDTCGIRL